MKGMLRYLLQHRLLLGLSLVLALLVGCDSLSLPDVSQKRYSAEVKRLAGEFRLPAATVHRVVKAYRKVTDPGRYRPKNALEASGQAPIIRETPQQALKRLSQELHVPEQLLERLVQALEQP